MATSAVALFRRRRLPPEERFVISISFDLPKWGNIHGLDKALSIILAIVIVGVIGTLAYIVATPRVGERFTEFYILGSEGKAADYPKELTVGEKAMVTVGIINHEHLEVSYRVEVRIDGVRNNETGPVVLGHEEKWEQPVSFTPTKLAENQKVEFVLYKEGEPHSQLHLWIDVIR